MSLLLSVLGVSEQGGFDCISEVHLGQESNLILTAMYSSREVAIYSFVLFLTLTSLTKNNENNIVYLYLLNILKSSLIRGSSF